MFNKAAEKTTALLILIGAPLTTLFLVIDTVTDPVNATKLFVAGGLGCGLLAVLIFFNLRQTLQQFRLFLTLIGLFIAASLNSVMNSDSPLTQNIYGSYGRNTGFIAYLVLAMISLGVLGIRELDNFRKIIIGLQVAGVVNVLYCAWVLAFGDFLGWNNPYGNILGLFGNPDFISAFLGIFIATLIALLASPNATLKWRITAGALALAAFYEIVKSHAIQGIVVTAGGIAIVGFFAVRSYLKKSILTAGYVISVVGVGILAVLGTLQKGPLSFVYKTSVSLRGAYWNAGTTMGMDHPLTGVGMDAYGDWYRRARSLKAATVLPGPKTFTNASHNVVLDFFAYGGFPLLITYLGMLVVAAIAIIKVIRRTKTYEPTFVAMVAAWACYEVQSVISINQVGLAIWGWLLTGALVAYEYATRTSTQEQDQPHGKSGKSKGNQSSGVISPQLVAGLGIIIGLLIAVPPLSADSKWRSALNSKDANKVLAVLEPGYLNPSDSQRFAQAVELFATSNLLDQAHQIALKATRYNPNYFDTWKQLYFLQNATPAEKEDALANMKRLDPLNQDVTAR
jgi:O-antigen ligase